MGCFLGGIVGFILSMMLPAAVELLVMLDVERTSYHRSQRMSLLLGVITLVCFVIGRRQATRPTMFSEQ